MMIWLVAVMLLTLVMGHDHYSALYSVKSCSWFGNSCLSSPSIRPFQRCVQSTNREATSTRQQH